MSVSPGERLNTNTAAARESWQGQIVDGKFPLLSWLGRSEHSSVFLTALNGQGSPPKVAIKLIPAGSSKDADRQIARWENARELAHPHLMRLFQAGRCRLNGTELLYLVMEYAEENLSEVLPARSLTPLETREMLPPVVDALAYMHRRSFVHGRIRPSNIMVVGEQLKLSSDSLHLHGDPTQHAFEASLYDAPEVWNAETSPSADIWSVGMLLVAALAQSPPVWDGSQQHEPVLPESIPEPFRGIARACLRQDPNNRCGLEYIREHLQSVPQVAVPPVKQPVTPQRRPVSRSRSRVITPVIAGLVLLAGLASLRFMNHRSRPAPAPASSEMQAPAPAAQSSGSSSAGNAARGAVSERVMPDVPRNASRTIHGKIKVSVRATVDNLGNVSAASLEHAGPSKYFANLALQAARRWKFTPPQNNGQAAASRWILRFQFTRTGDEATAEQLPR
jgi:TonB family protein